MLSCLLALCAGCQSLIRPSAAKREASYSKIKDELAVSESELFRANYFVYAGDPLPEPDFTCDTPNGFTLTVKTKGYGGVAVAVDSDGYLLTAAHVPSKDTYVVGFMDGRLQLRRATLVHKLGSAIIGREFALLYVGAHLDAPKKLSASAVEGSVFCVGRRNIFGNFLMFAGRCLDNRVYQDPPAGRLLVTDAPLWYGDSGGGAFRADGTLVGINTAFRCGWWDGRLRYERYIFAPDPAELARLIEEHRATLAKPVIE